MKKLGLIGFPLTHSFSKTYFNEKFNREKLTNYQYNNYELKEMNDFSSLMSREENLLGLNVTIPHKEKVLSFLDEIDFVAKEIGAVNTIHVQANGKLKGYNTDAIGFRNSIKPFLDTNHNRALIFGTGGSSKAVAYVLENLEIPYYFISRTPKTNKEISYEDVDQEVIKSYRFLINCTPLGTFPSIHEMIPIDPSGIGKTHLVYDLVYNPAETALLKAAKQQGAIAVNGLSMLRLQAEASWNIWTKEAAL